MPKPSPEGQDTRTMPAGDDRREQARINADVLAAQAEEHPTEKIDLAKLAAIADERESRQKYERHPQNGQPHLRIQHEQPGYVYCLVCTRQEGIQISLKESEMVEDADGYMIPVWELVKGDMPEAPNWRDAVGLRRVADTVLMRARKDRYILLQRQRRQHDAAMRDAGDANLLDLERDLQRKGVGVAVRVNDPLSDPRLKREATRAAAAGIGRRQFEQQLRDGTVRGMEVRK